jgi:hypothetical protein
VTTRFGAAPLKRLVHGLWKMGGVAPPLRSDALSSLPVAGTTSLLGRKREYVASNK